jgi:hypothetical protein
VVVSAQKMTPLTAAPSFSRRGMEPRVRLFACSRCRARSGCGAFTPALVPAPVNASTSRDRGALCSSPSPVGSSWCRGMGLRAPSGMSRVARTKVDAAADDDTPPRPPEQHIRVAGSAGRYGGIAVSADVARCARTAGGVSLPCRFPGRGRPRWRMGYQAPGSGWQRTCSRW